MAYQRSGTHQPRLPGCPGTRAYHALYRLSFIIFDSPALEHNFMQTTWLLFAFYLYSYGPTDNYHGPPDVSIEPLALIRTRLDRYGSRHVYSLEATRLASIPMVPKVLFEMYGRGAVSSELFLCGRAVDCARSAALPNLCSGSISWVIYPDCLYIPRLIFGRS